MGKEMDRTVVRDEILNRIVTMLTNDGDDPRAIASGEIMMPVVDKDGNEFFATVKVSIPRGARKNGTYIPYDGYAAADEYAITVEAKAQEKAIKEENKRRKVQEKERKAKAKKIIKKLNTVGFKALVSEPIENEDKDNENQYLDKGVTV